MDYRKAIEYFERELNCKKMALSPLLDGKESLHEQYLKTAISAMQELQQYKQLGTLEEVREAVETVRRYDTQYPDDMRNPLEPLKVSSALKSEIMKLEFRKQSKPESISVLDYTIIAALQKALEEVCGEEE